MRLKCYIIQKLSMVKILNLKFWPCWAFWLCWVFSVTTLSRKPCLVNLTGDGKGGRVLRCWLWRAHSKHRGSGSPGHRWWLAHGIWAFCTLETTPGRACREKSRETSLLALESSFTYYSLLCLLLSSILAFLSRPLADNFLSMLVYTRPTVTRAASDFQPLVA